MPALTLHEEPLGAAASASSSGLVAAVTENRSVVRVPAFATAAEVELLRAEGERAAEAQEQNPHSSSMTRQRLEVFARSLHSSGTLSSLSIAVQTLAESLVRRAIRLVQTELPALADAIGLTLCTAQTELHYSEGEPAINVYSGPGGDFKAHQDMRALTLLLPLTSPQTDYQDGGTAFYAPDAQLADAVRGRAKPTAVLRPPAGTALLWGGTLIHAGAEVSAGRRLVFVASFSPRSPQDEAT